MHWIGELTARFKTSPSEAMDALLKENYTVEDVRNGRDPMAYVQAVIRHGKSARLPLYNSVLFAWRNLDSTLQLHVPRPTIETSESQFIDILLARKEVWIRHFSRPPSPRGFRRFEPTNRGYSTNPPPYGNGPYPGHSENNRQFDTTNRGYPTNPPRPYENRGYNPRPYDPQNDTQNRGNQPPSQQPPLRPRRAPREHEPRPSHPPQPAYHADPNDDVEAHLAAYYADPKPANMPPKASTPATAMTRQRIMATQIELLRGALIRARHAKQPFHQPVS